MKNTFFILLLLIFSCKKSSLTNQKTDVNQYSSKEYVFDYHKIVENVEGNDLQNNNLYKLEDYIIPISKSDFIKDSLLYKNDLLPNNALGKDYNLNTSFGKVKLLVNKDKGSDSYVDYSYAGFNKKINAHIINVQLYEGEIALLMNDKSYRYNIVNDIPLFSNNQEYALDYKDQEGLSSYLTLYRIENDSLSKYYTLSSDENIIENVFWNNDNNPILKLRNLSNRSYKFYKIEIKNLNHKSKETNVKINDDKIWKGEYEIETKAISNYDGEIFNLKYFISINSPFDVVLSIGANHSEDYWCEGDYNLNIENNIVHASGKCDEDDKNDFFLKYENGKYYIKSKRFIDQNWQELKKE